MPTKRTGDKIEPSKVVVFPDSAVKGTDTRNMQIKEFHPQDGKGKWLAVHIPDHMPYPRKKIKIIASINAAKDLEKVVGPTKETLAMEIQSLLGINEENLQKMIAKGNSDDENEGDDEGDEEEEENDDDNDDDDDEGDVTGDPLDDEPMSSKCDDSNSVSASKHKKKCRPLGKDKSAKTTSFGSGLGDQVEENDDDKKPKLHVEQPEGFELRWEDIINNFKNFSVKRKKKICKLFALQNDMCERVTRRRKHSFKRKLKHYLLKMLRKFLKKNKSAFEDYLSTRLKDALAGRIQPSEDGLLHIYDKNSGKMNMEDFLKDLNDGTPPQLGTTTDETRLALPQSNLNPMALTMDDNTINGNVFRVTPQTNSEKLTTEEAPDQSTPDAVSALNNIIHPLLNDQDNNMDERLQTKILQEELSHVNAEQEEQERQRKKDASLNDRLMYMFKLQNLANHKLETTDANGEIGGQPISIVNPHQVSLMQMDLPDKNPDIPLLTSSSSKESETSAKARTRIKDLPFRRKAPFTRRVVYRPRLSLYDRPRLLGTLKLRTSGNGTWRPTGRSFWKRSYASKKKPRRQVT